MAISTWLQKILNTPATEARPPISVDLATAAALLIEVSRADANIDELETREIDKLLHVHTNLNDQELAELLSTADQAVEQAVSLVDFSRVLVDTLSGEERGAVVDMLWRVAFADGRIDRYEDYYIRKISDLLYVPHARFIQGKLRASGEL